MIFIEKRSRDLATSRHLVEKVVTTSHLSSTQRELSFTACFAALQMLDGLDWMLNSLLMGIIILTNFYFSFYYNICLLCAHFSVQESGGNTPMPPNQLMMPMNYATLHLASVSSSDTSLENRPMVHKYFLPNSGKRYPVAYY